MERESGSRKQEAEGRRQEAAGRRQKAEVRKQKAADKWCPLPFSLVLGYCLLPPAVCLLLFAYCFPSAFGAL
jgi:hypothetical protein